MSIASAFDPVPSLDPVPKNTLRAQVAERLRTAIALRDRKEGRAKQLFDQAISGTLPHQEIEAVCSMINDEFLMKGIEPRFRAQRLRQRA